MARKPTNLVGKGFESRPQDINRKGRPKKIYTILKEKGYSKDDVNTAFGELSFYTLKELKELLKDETKPIIVRIVSKQFVSAYENSDWGKIREILEHSIGKPKQSIEQEVKSEININFED